MNSTVELTPKVVTPPNVTGSNTQAFVRTTSTPQSDDFTSTKTHPLIVEIAEGRATVGKLATPKPTAEFLSAQADYPLIGVDAEKHSSVDPALPNPADHAQWEAIAKVRRKLKKLDVGGSSLTEAQRTSTIGFVRALSARWDAAFMRANWKQRVVDRVADAFAAGVSIMGTAEWDAELTALAAEKGLGVSSSARKKNGLVVDGNGVVFDGDRFELVEESKHVFANSSTTQYEKIWHEVVLREQNSGKFLVVQSAHFEKRPDSPTNHGVRVEQAKEIGRHARRMAKKYDAPVILLADSNSLPWAQGKKGTKNAVDVWLSAYYQTVTRANGPTSITGQRSANIDIIAAVHNDGLELAEDSEGAAAVRATLGELVADVGSNNIMLPNASNPSDHKMVVQGFAFGETEFVASAWNVMDGRYRNPLKGNLLYPFMFALQGDVHRQACTRLRRAWGMFYELAKELPGWQRNRVPDEQLFCSEYLVGEGLDTLHALKLAVEEQIASWDEDDRAHYETDRRNTPDLYADAADYGLTGESVWVFLNQLDALRQRPALAGC